MTRVTGLTQQLVVYVDTHANTHLAENQILISQTTIKEFYDVKAT